MIWGRYVHLIFKLPHSPSPQHLNDTNNHTQTQMEDEFMNDPAFQTGGGIGQATVITPTNGPKPTPAPASSTAPAKAHVPMASSSSPSLAPSSTPTPTSSMSVSATTAAFTSTGADATATPSDKKDKESFLKELPLVGDAMRLLGGA